MFTTAPGFHINCFTIFNTVVKTPARQKYPTSAKTAYPVRTVQQIFANAKIREGYKPIQILLLKNKIMKDTPKLFLYSLSLTNRHYEYLDKLTGKKRNDIHFACIENATDIIDGSEHWVPVSGNHSAVKAIM
jgi:hypothetical protein